jgi:RDD family.
MDVPVQPAAPASVRVVWVAGFWLRLAALLIDVVAVTGVMSVMVVLSWLLRGSGAEGAFDFFVKNPRALLVLVIMYFLLMGTYLALFTRFGGQSLGQILLGLQVIHETGQQLTTGQVLRRMVGIVCATLPGLAGFLWVGFDLQRRGWHDYIGHSLVIRLRPPRVAHKEVVTLRDMGA